MARVGKDVDACLSKREMVVTDARRIMLKESDYRYLQAHFLITRRGLLLTWSRARWLVLRFKLCWWGGRWCGLFV
jgi:hypothetical protein